MGLVKTRRLAAMQKQQRAKAGMKPTTTRRNGSWPLPPDFAKCGGRMFGGTRRTTNKSTGYKP